MARRIAPTIQFDLLKALLRLLDADLASGLFGFHN